MPFESLLKAVLKGFLKAFKRSLTKAFQRPLGGLAKGKAFKTRCKGFLKASNTFKMPLNKLKNGLGLSRCWTDISWMFKDLSKVFQRHFKGL